MAVGDQFLHVDDGAVGNATDPVQPFAAGTLDFDGSLGFSTQQGISSKGDCCSAKNDSVDAERVHECLEKK